MSEGPTIADAGERLAKVMARAGLCSRRDAEGWITEGRVSVNGKVVRTPAFNVTAKDKIKVDGEPLKARAGTRLWLYHKPPGLVVTEDDPEGRETIFDKLAAEGLPRVLSVGRLDINTEGLLLLTNDGGLKRVLELPSTGWLRRYRVRAFGEITQQALDGLANGMTVDGVTYGPIEAVLERQQGANVWMVVALREGKNREVKNILESLGLQVNRLIRISYGPFQLGELPVGGIETVKARVLREQLGTRLAREAGVDFDSEMPELAPGVQSAANPKLRAKPDGEVSFPHRRPAGHSKRPEADAGPKPRLGAPSRSGRRPVLAEKRPPRDEGPMRRILHQDGSEPQEFRPQRKKREEGDADARPPRAGGFGKPDGARPPRPAGDRPSSFKRGPREDRPEGRSDRSDRPARSFGDKPQRSFGDKPQRAAGDRPDRPPRKFGDKPAGKFGDRPPRSGGPAGAGAAPGKKPYVKRPPREAGAEDRPARAPRSFGPRPDSKPAGAGRPSREGRPEGERPRGPRPAGGKPTGGRPGGSRPPGNRPAGAGPRRSGPGGGAGGKPRSPRPPRA